MSQGWGFPIDYDKEIAADQARVAHLSSELSIRISRELVPDFIAAYPSYGLLEPYRLITYKIDGLAERSAVLGLTLEDVRAWAYFCDEDRLEVWGLLGDEQKGDYARGAAIDKRFDYRVFETYTEEKRKKALSKARADLSRHKRNKEK